MKTSRIYPYLFVVLLLIVSPACGGLGPNPSATTATEGPSEGLPTDATDVANTIYLFATQTAMGAGGATSAAGTPDAQTTPWAGATPGTETPPAPTQTTQPQTQPTQAPQATPIPTEYKISGQVVFSHPETLIVERVDAVYVYISPLKEIASTSPFITGPVEADIEISIYDDRGKGQEHKTTLKLYPFMSAELTSGTEDIIDIHGGANNWIHVEKDKPILWIWEVTAHKDGKQKLILKLFGASELVAGEPAAGYKYLVRTVEGIVIIEDRPFLERFGEWFEKNSLVIFGTGGPIALIVLIAGGILGFLRYRASKNSNDKERQEENNQKSS